MPCLWLENVDINGFDVQPYNPLTGVKTWQECSNHCFAETKCYAWTLAWNVCYLKNNGFINGVTDVSGKISGIQRCGKIIY